MQPLTKRGLGATIIASALAGMISGMAAPSKFNEVAPGRFQQDFSGSIAAGGAAAQKFTQAGNQAEAQGQANDAKLRAYATVDHNLKFHTMSIANDKADRENQQDVVSTWDSTRDAMDAEAKDGKVQDSAGNDLDLYSYKDISGVKAMELVNNHNLNVTRDQLIPTQVVDVPNANGGGTHAETLFSVYNPAAMVAMSDGLRKDNPRLKDVTNGTPINVRVLAQSALNRSNLVLATAGVDNWTSSYNKSNPKAQITDGFSLKSAIAANPIINKLLPAMTKYHKDEPDQFFTDLQKDTSFAKDATIQAASAKLQDAMGITPDGLAKMGADRDAAKKAAETAVKPINTIGEAREATTNPDSSPAAMARKKQGQAFIDSAQADEVATELRKTNASVAATIDKEQRHTDAQLSKDTAKALVPVWSDVRTYVQANNLIKQAEAPKASSSDAAYADKALAMAALRAEMAITQHYRVTQAEIEMQYNNGTLAEQFSNKFKQALVGGFDHQTRMGMLNTIQTVAQTGINLTQQQYGLTDEQLEPIHRAMAGNTSSAGVNAPPAGAVDKAFNKKDGHTYWRDANKKPIGLVQ